MFQLPRLFALLAVLAVVYPAIAAAHPHVWVTYDMVIQFNAGKVVALKERWVFDEDFTSALLRDITKNRKPGKPLTKAEAAKVKQNGFDNLQNYGYFQHVAAERSSFNVKPPQDFVARLDGAHLVYEFTLPLEQAVDPHQRRVTLGLYDESYFVDYQPTNPNAVTLTGDGIGSCKLNSFEDRAHPIFYGTVNPLVWKLNC